MPVSATVSEVILLDLIWLAALLLSAASVVILAILIIRRFFSAREEVRNTTRKSELSRYFFAAINSPIELTEESLPELKKGDKPLVTEIAMGILRTVHGSDVDRIISMLHIWNLLPYLHHNLYHGSRGMKIRILTLLTYFKDEESLGELLLYSSYSDHYVQLAALRGLSYRKAGQYIDQIVENLGESQQTNSLVLADILTQFGEVAVPALLFLINKDTLIEIRLAAITALGTIGDLRAVGSLIKLLDNSSQEIKAQAIVSLGKLGDARAGDAIASHLKDKNIAVRVQAVQALGLLDIPSSILSFAEALDDEEWWVRYRAAEALYNMGSSGVALLQAISKTEGQTSIISSQVLAEKGGI